MREGRMPDGPMRVGQTPDVLMLGAMLGGQTLGLYRTPERRKTVELMPELRTRGLRTPVPLTLVRPIQERRTPVNLTRAATLTPELTLAHPMPVVRQTQVVRATLARPTPVVNPTRG
jgi:hypothetical protein